MNGKVTPKKSKYFEGSDDDGADEVSSAEDISDFDDEDPSTEEVSASESDDEEDYDSEEDRKPWKKKGKKLSISRSVDTPTTLGGNSKELWRPGVKTGLGPGKQVFIEKPKPRGDGGIKYTSDKIHPNTMAFLADLKKNNDREWLKMHDPDYRQAWKDWESFVEALTEKISEIDETIPELPPKDLVFRIYRDVRFSSDPTPYKTHFSAAWSRTGRKGPFACYYVQIQPGGKSFVGSGLWMPEAAALALVRTDIDRKPHKMKNVLMAPAVRKSILGGVGRDEKKTIKAFTSHNSESALKTKPKGYDADNPNIELLRLRSFTMGKRLADNEILSTKGAEIILELLQAMTPFVTYLNSVVMPDDDASSSEIGGSEESEDDQRS